MARRIFLCANVRFPRGEAGANYVQYLALALIEKDWDVILLGEGTNRPQDYNAEKKKYEYKGIEYFNLVSGEETDYGFVTYNFRYGKYFEEALMKYKADQADYAFLYSSSISAIDTIKKFIPQDHLSISIVEWHRPSQYRLKLISPSYLITRYSYFYIHRNIKKVFPISTQLEQYFKKHSCNTLLLPAMADPYEYGYPGTKRNGKIIFIYSGTKSTKQEDAVEAMLKAFVLLSKKDLSRLEFHITGLSLSRIQHILHGDSKLFGQLEKILVIHEWMEYEELVKLYLTADFLFLARNDNAITRANFPSKVPELLCYGVTPVCSEVGDYTQYYLDDKVNGIIFKGCSEEACRQAILRALGLSPKERVRLRENCRNTALQVFDYRQWADKITDFLIR